MGSQTWEDRHRLLLIHRLRTSFGKAGYSATHVYNLFEKFDEDGNGTLDCNEFSALIQILGVAVDDSTVEEVFSYFDHDDEGSIDFGELMCGIFPSTHWILNKSTTHGGAKPKTNGGAENST